MQTLPAGSFLNLENTSAVENLKFTARLLAEHSSKVIKEELGPAALENLAKNLWQKAEYVTRETERRRAEQIFSENFIERFRELKPDLSALPIDSISALLRPPAAPEAKLTGETNSHTVDLPAIQITATPPSAIEVKEDEFLGIVNSGEQFVETVPVHNSPATITETTEQTNVQPSPVNVSVTNSTANEITPPEIMNPDRTHSENVSTDVSTLQTTESIFESAETVTEPPEITAPQSVPQANQITPKPVETPTKTADQVKAATQSAPKAEDEPFEFGKCTVSLNLILLPPASGAEKTRRQVIISAASHQLPPEIEFLELEGLENLDQITTLVRNKLIRFAQTLPVKYMEKLRSAKAKGVKTNPPAAQPTASQSVTAEKSSGSQTAGVVNTQAVVKTEVQLPITGAANTAQNAANSPQQSLF